MPEALNPAERYAALKTLNEGLDAALKTAQSEADEYRKQVRAKQLTTDHGLVYVTTSKPSVAILDQAGLLEWCAIHKPDLIEQTIPTKALTWLKANAWEVQGDDVVDRESGEVLDFAEPKAGGVESVSFRATPEAKAMAVEAVAARLEALTAAMQPAIEQPAPVPSTALPADLVNVSHPPQGYVLSCTLCDHEEVVDDYSPSARHTAVPKAIREHLAAEHPEEVA